MKENKIKYITLTDGFSFSFSFFSPSSFTGKRKEKKILSQKGLKSAYDTNEPVNERATILKACEVLGLCKAHNNTDTTSLAFLINVSNSSPVSSEMDFGRVGTDCHCHLKSLKEIPHKL